MEFLKKSIHMDQIGCEEQTQITLEDDVNIADAKPDVYQVVTQQGHVGVLLENHRAGRRFRQNRGWGRQRHRCAGFQGLCCLRRRQENHQHTACQRPKPFACLHCLFLL